MLEEPSLDLGRRGVGGAQGGRLQQTAAGEGGRSLKEFTDEIREELSKSGEVIRETMKSASAAVCDASINANIKGRLLLEPGLRGVGVETTSGAVTLTGRPPC